MLYDLVTAGLLRPASGSRRARSAGLRLVSGWLLVVLVVAADLVGAATLLGGNLGIAAAAAIAGVSMILLGSLWGRRPA